MDMTACIDWLQFTIKQFEGKNATPENVIREILGLESIEFEVQKGHYGYAERKYSNGISVYYNGSADMGIHVQMSGKGVRFYEQTNNIDWKDYLFMLTSWFNVNVTRIDIAIDEYENLLDIDRIRRYLKKGQVISRFKKYKPEREYSLSGNEKLTDTIYFGDRTSEIFFRLYDKKLERKCNGEDCTYEFWNRFEIVMKNERAMNFIAHLINRDNFGNLEFLVKSVVNNYIRICKETKDTNKQRWENADFWNVFLDKANKLKLTNPKKDITIEETYQWVKKSVAPSLKLLVDALGSNELILELVNNAKLNKRQQTLLNEYLQVKQLHTEII